MIYLLIPAIALLLSSAQASWATLFKTKSILEGSIPHIVSTVALDWRLWVGGVLYALATILYFVALNKLNFFVIQFTVTGLVIVASILYSTVLFHEKIHIINIVGILIIMLGVYFVIGYK